MVETIELRDYEQAETNLALSVSKHGNPVRDTEASVTSAQFLPPLDGRVDIVTSRA